MEDREKDKIEPPEQVTPINTPDSTTVITQETEKSAVDECEQCVKLNAELEEQKALVAKQKTQLEDMKSDYDIAAKRLDLHKCILTSYQPETQELEKLRIDVKNLKDYSAKLETEVHELKEWQENVFKETENELKRGRVDASTRTDPEITHQQDRPVSQNSGYESRSAQSYNTDNRDYHDNGRRNDYPNRNSGGDHRHVNFNATGYRGGYNRSDSFNRNQGGYNNNTGNNNYQRERGDSNYQDCRGRYESGDRSEIRQSFDNQSDARSGNQQQRSNIDYQQRERYPSENRPQGQQGYNNQGYNRHYNQSRSDYNSRNTERNTDGYDNQKDTQNYNQNRSGFENRGGHRGGYHTGERRGSQNYHQNNYSDSNYQNRSIGRYDNDDRAEKSQGFHSSNYNNRDGNSYYQRNRQDSNNQGGNDGRNYSGDRSDGRNNYSNQRDNRGNNQENRSVTLSYLDKSIDVRHPEHQEDRGGYHSEGDHTPNRRNTYENTGSLQRQKSSYNKEQGHHQGYHSANSAEYSKVAKNDPLVELIDHDLADDEAEAEPQQQKKSEKKFHFNKPGFGEFSDDDEDTNQSKSSGGYAVKKSPSKKEDENDRRW